MTAQWRAFQVRSRLAGGAPGGAGGPRADFCALRARLRRLQGFHRLGGLRHLRIGRLGSSEPAAFDRGARRTGRRRGERGRHRGRGREHGRRTGARGARGGVAVGVGRVGVGRVGVGIGRVGVGIGRVGIGRVGVGRVGVGIGRVGGGGVGVRVDRDRHRGQRPGGAWRRRRGEVDRAQLVAQLGGELVTPTGVPGAGAGDDPLQVGGRRGLAARRPFTGEQLVEDDAERVHVAAGVGRQPGHLLRGQVADGAEHHARLGERLADGRLRDAEVGDLHAPTRREQHVARLHVAVDDTVVVGVCQRVGDLRPDRRHLGRRQRTALLELGPQAAALHELHHDEGLGAAAPVVDADHVGVVQARRGTGFALEPLRRGRGEGGGGHLDRHRPFEQAVAGAVHVAHAARAQQHLEFVTVSEELRDRRHPPNLPSDEARIPSVPPRGWHPARKPP